MVNDDDGFSLVEVIIAMAVLALIAIFTLPLFMQALVVSVDNSSRTTANAKVNQVIEQARVSPTCDSLTALETAPPADFNFTDGRGAALTVHATLDSGGCAANTAVPLTITVTRDGDGTQVTQAVTRILVGATP